MRTIKEHIKQNTYKPVYLIYGTESYLKNLYKNKLKEGILLGSDEMNYTRFEGKGIEINKIIEIAETLPFFSDRRIIMIEDSGLFKSQSDLADYIKEIPEATHIVFVESEIDKRNRLFKAVKEIGTISEMNGMDENNLKLWITSILDKDNKKITGNTLMYFLNKSGSNMENISQELEKLSCYTLGREVITIEDIDEICTTQISNKIFQMIDAIASKKQSIALGLYYDLLSLREKPMSILFLITRHFNMLYQVKELEAIKVNNAIISQRTGLPPFAISKYIAQSKNFNTDILKEALNTCADIEEQVKTGRLIDTMGVELLIVKYSS